MQDKKHGVREIEDYLKRELRVIGLALVIIFFNNDQNHQMSGI